MGTRWFCLSAATNFPGLPEFRESQGGATQRACLQFDCDEQGVRNDKKANRRSFAKYNYEGG